jgi:hypothetical protein
LCALIIIARAATTAHAIKSALVAHTTSQISEDLHPTPSAITFWRRNHEIWMVVGILFYRAHYFHKIHASKVKKVRKELYFIKNLFI